MKKDNAPMEAMLLAAKDRVRLHMPGHKGRLDPFDTTELPVTDDLYAPESGIRRAEEMAARAFGAAHTLMLTGGSTAGILAMLLAYVLPGEQVILPRNAHHSALSACVWGGLDAVFADELSQAVARHPQARAVFVTRPDYYGRCMDLAPLCAQAHAAGMRVLVDEAHGAHFAWWDQPQSAGRLGADAWVQSAHKTLPALGGGAWLHLAEGMDARRARRFLRMVQTSSPPFPILRSLDNARAWMDAHGREALAALCAQIRVLRRRIEALGGYVCRDTDDPTRLVIETLGRGATGFAAQDALGERGVDVEMADDEGLVCILTPMDERTWYDRLVEALAPLPQGTPLARRPVPLPPPGPRAMSVREAALAPQEATPLDRAEGRVAAVSAGLYPPGTPLVLPGERVTGPAVERLRRMPPSRRFGVEDGCLICVK